MSNPRKAALHLCGATFIGISALATSTALAGGAFYQQHNLVSDGAVTADHLDPNLVNPWGIAFNPYAASWVADNHTGLSTLYDGAGDVLSLVVPIPGPGGATVGAPTGTVYNGSSGFVITQGDLSGPAVFLFAGEDGVIAGWAPKVNSAQAYVVVDNSTSGTVYKGLAISGDGAGGKIYATDFHNNKIDVYDSGFQPVTTGGFVDPNLPAGFAPFGIQAIGGDLYVTYAKQDADAHDNLDGAGLGYVDVYDPSGKLIRRLASRGWLNAPWGLALAPAGFGEFAGRLLVGNFGDGKINAYDVATGYWVGQLKSAARTPIQIPGLWGLEFGNGYSSQPVDTLFFAAGPNDEANGLYGRIDVK